jgi:hypothetical protein
MPNLKFVSLECIRPDDIREDESGFDVGEEDEPFLLVNHNQVWRGRMSSGDVRDLSAIESIPFDNQVSVELRERDPGYVPSDDSLGTFNVQALHAGLGEIEHQFETRRAKYVLKYQVE